MRYMSVYYIFRVTSASYVFNYSILYYNPIGGNGKSFLSACVLQLS